MDAEQLSLAESFLAEMKSFSFEGFPPNSSDTAIDKLIQRILSSPSFPHKNSLRWYRSRTELLDGDEQQLLDFAELLTIRVRESKMFAQRMSRKKLLPANDEFRTRFSVLNSYFEEIFSSTSKELFIETFHPESGAQYHREVYDWMLDYAEEKSLPCNSVVSAWVAKVLQKVALEPSDRMGLLEIFNRLKRTFEKKMAKEKSTSDGAETLPLKKKLLVLDTSLMLSSPVSLHDNIVHFLRTLADYFVFGIWTNHLTSVMLSGLLQELFQGTQVSFLFVFGSDKSTVVSKSPSATSFQKRKDLGIVWKSYPAYSEANTIIIDDSPETLFSTPLWCCILQESFAAKPEPLATDGCLTKLLTRIGRWSHSLRDLFMQRSSIPEEEREVLEFGLPLVARFSREYSTLQEITNAIFAVCPRNQFSTNPTVPESLLEHMRKLKTWAAEYAKGAFLPCQFLAADLADCLDRGKQLTAHQRTLQLLKALARFKVHTGNCFEVYSHLKEYRRWQLRVVSSFSSWSQKIMITMPPRLLSPQSAGDATLNHRRRDCSFATSTAC